MVNWCSTGVSPVEAYSSILILSGVVYAPGSLFDYPELFY